MLILSWFMNTKLINNMKYITLIFLMVLSISCAKKTSSPPVNIEYGRTGKVNFIKANKSLLTVESEQSGGSFQQAAYYAEINALENILYRGIPGSSQEQAIIADEVQAQRNSPLVLKGLVFNNGYKIFLTESEPLESYKNEGVYTVRQKVTFDVLALRRFLEKNEVIQKFGF
jgi:hypothetical protein